MIQMVPISSPQAAQAVPTPSRTDQSSSPPITLEDLKKNLEDSMYNVFEQNLAKLPTDDINKELECKKTLLQFVCALEKPESEHVDVVKTLLDKGADRNNSETNEGPVLIAAARARPKILNVLIHHGTDGATQKLVLETTHPKSKQNVLHIVLRKTLVKASKGQVKDNETVVQESTITGDKDQVKDNETPVKASTNTGDKDQVKDNQTVVQESTITGDKDQVKDNETPVKASTITGDKDQVKDNEAPVKASTNTGDKDQVKDNETRYSECLNILLECEIKSLINKQDNLGNTPLHYATKAGWSEAIVRKLLDLGANMAIKNKRGEIPLTRISPETLKDFMDQACLEPTDLGADFAFNVDYSRFQPPVPESIGGNQANPGLNAVKETTWVWHMIQTPTHKHLVTHPMVKIFLTLKWQRMRRFFNQDLRFYFLFVAILTSYIFERFDGNNLDNRDFLPNNESLPQNISGKQIQVDYCTEPSSSIWNESVQKWQCTHWILLVLSAILVIAIIVENIIVCGEKDCRIINIIVDVFTSMMILIVLFGTSSALNVFIGLVLTRMFVQLISSCKHYFLSFESWIEIVMIGIVAYVKFSSGDGSEHACHTQKQWAGFVILFSWTKLMIKVGRHPFLSLHNKYTTMLFKVIKTFLFFLVWYVLILLAFGLGFYIMLHRVSKPAKEEEKGEKEAEKVQYFNNPWLTLVKSSVMATGELELSNIPIYNDSQILECIFLLSFLFFIVIVLMSLLNSMAVSDIAAIEHEANITTLASKAAQISKAEAMMLNFLGLKSLCKRFCNTSCHKHATIIEAQRIMVFNTNAKGEKGFKISSSLCEPYDGCCKDCIRRFKQEKDWENAISEVRKIFQESDEEKEIFQESDKEKEIFQESDEEKQISQTLQNMKAELTIIKEEIVKISQSQQR